MQVTAGCLLGVWWVTAGCLVSGGWNHLFDEPREGMIQVTPG